jgi:DinB family
VTIGQTFLKEVEDELKSSRRLIERVPGDKARWKPHPKSSALGHLTQLVCRMPKVMSDIVKGVDLDLSAGPGYSFEPTDVLLREFDENVAELRRTLSNAKDTDFQGTWNVRAGADIYDSAERQDALRNTINHFVHHRGQLTVYLRLLDVPIPQLYGPTADER